MAGLVVGIGATLRRIARDDNNVVNNDNSNYDNLANVRDDDIYWLSYQTEGRGTAI